MSGSGYGSGGGSNPSGFQGRMSSSSDYPKKYTSQTSPGAGYDTSPPPYKRNKKEW